MGKKKHKIKPEANTQSNGEKRDKKSEVLGKKKSSGGGKSTLMGVGIGLDTLIRTDMEVFGALWKV